MNRELIALQDKTHLLPDVVGQLPPGRSSSRGYETALTVAGVTVHALEEFGSYQGDWWAEVEFPNGEVYYVNGYYGSCTGCDAFQGEFGESAENEPNYLHRLRDFGADYLRSCYTLEQAIASGNLSWDTEAEKAVAWLKSRAKEAPDEPRRLQTPPEAE